MFKRLFRVVNSLLIASLLVLSYTNISLAYDEVLCNGVISGTTNYDNPNVGKTYFGNRVSGDGGLYFWQNSESPLGIIGGGTGFAPADSFHAACVDSDDDVYGPLNGDSANDEFIVRGWSWNDNLGFISWYCDGTDNQGVACGTESHQVVVNSADEYVAGERQLVGYAWNSTYGWMNFYCDGSLNDNGLGQSCGPYDYGVTVNTATGAVSGHAFTQAGVYVNFDGMNLQLPGASGPVVGDGCDGKPYVCVDFTPGPEGLDGSLDVGEDGAALLADGSDGYELNLYLRDATGTTGLDSSTHQIDKFFESLEFNWTDSVKIDQRAGSTVNVSTLSKVERPWTDTTYGGIVYKPLNGLTSSDFTLVDAADGHWRLKTPIQSFAPTSNANFSRTSSLSPNIAVSNEQFLFTYDEASGTMQPNELVLNRLDYELLTNGGTPEGSGDHYVNNSQGFSLKFKPVIDVGVLFSGDSEDNINAFRGIPVNLRTAVNVWKEIGTKSSIKFDLVYSQEETDLACLGLEEGFTDFDFYFLNDVKGEDISEGRKSQISVADFSLLANEVDLPVLASLPAFDSLNEEEQQSSLPCNAMQGPGLITTVGILVDGKTIVYYSNKLPRVAGGLISNPVAQIAGNVYSQLPFTPNAETEIPQSPGSVNNNFFREQTTKNLADIEEIEDVNLKTSGECTVTGFNSSTIKFSGCTEGTDYIQFEEQGEKGVYLQGVDLNLDVGNFGGQYVFINEGGNIFIEDDLWVSDYDSNFDDSNRVTVMALCRHNQNNDGECGNIYVHPDVRNINANMVTDRGFYTYSGDKLDIDADGFPVWANQTERENILNRQLAILGSLSCPVCTIGGSDLDARLSGAFEDAKPFIVYWGGRRFDVPITPEERLKAQSNDINYLRLAKYRLEKTANGLPVDQSCNKGMTYEDILTCNEFGPGSVVNDATGESCDCLDPLNPAPIGDLVPPDDPEFFAIGKEEEPGSVYVDFRPSDSFIFEQEDTINTSNF